ncbi:MAG: hypothetical protein V2A73_09615, partial [Pseudomonadota bacterium]
AGASAGMGMTGEVLGEIELRTVRLSLKTVSHRRLQAGKLFLERLLGRLVQHRTDELKSLSGKTLNSDEIPSLPPESPGGRSDRPSVVDVEGAIDGFNEKVGEQIRRFIKEQTDTSKARKPLPLGNPDEQPKQQPSSSETDRPDRALLKEKRHRLPLMAHEVMKQEVPGFGEVVKETARLLRHDRWEIERVVQTDELAGLKTVDSFLKTHALRCMASGTTEQYAVDDANTLGHHLFLGVNFELCGRKTFWVDESLAFLLSQTDLDITGNCLKLPFASCAFVFTDRGTLELGESLLGLEYECSFRDQELRIITVHVTRTQGGANDEVQGITLAFMFDAGLPKWPYLISRDLCVRPDDHLDAILDSHFPEIDAGRLDAVFHSPELKKLVHLVVNAILYSTAAHLEPIILQPANRPAQQPTGKDKTKKGGKPHSLTNQGGGELLSSENVFFLPGHIEISRVRRFQELAKSQSGRTIMKRFMVRGHWRKANPDWKNKETRWIKPYWKGPDIAAVVEHDYRLKP